METYDIGDSVVTRIECRARPTDTQRSLGLPGDLTDPTVLTVTVQRQSDLAVVFTLGVAAEIVHVSTGLYDFNFTTVAAGEIKVRAVAGPGGLTAAGQNAFRVRNSNIS